MYTGQQGIVNMHNMINFKLNKNSRDIYQYMYTIALQLCCTVQFVLGVAAVL